MPLSDPPATAHPGLAAAMRTGAPVATRETAWANGTMPLHVSAYTTAPELPLELVTSIRCIVRVRGGELIVYCENADGSHPMPGGRRIEGESFADTAAREVHEETGWRIDRATLRRLGWIRLAHLGPEPEVKKGPYPDFLQIVFTAEAVARDVARDAEWTDTDGYESSRLLPLEEARRRSSSNDLLASVFLDLLFADRDQAQS
jgi:8-oxo-dGTP pyrophosphatase MutT (NUDIX family)